MRAFGYVLLIAGCFAAYQCHQRMKSLEPLPAGFSVEDSLRTDRGKMEAGRFAGVGVAAIGLVLALFPEGK
jgi:hypothetical protein